MCVACIAVAVIVKMTEIFVYRRAVEMGRKVEGKAESNDWQPKVWEKAVSNHLPSYSDFSNELSTAVWLLFLSFLFISLHYGVY